MADERSLTELIEKYHHQAASTAELAELELWLRDRAALEGFVAAQRMNAWLEALLKEEFLVKETTALLHTIETARQRRPWKAWLGIAATVLLLVGVTMWRPWVGRALPPMVSNRATSPLVAPVAELEAAEVLTVFGIASARAVK